MSDFQYLFPDCDSTETPSRGLCRRHYQVARKRICNGHADEDDLIERGLMLPAHTTRPSVVFDVGSEVKGYRDKALCSLECAVQHLCGEQENNSTAIAEALA